MLALDAVRAILDDVQYRPGWTLELVEGCMEAEGPRLRIIADVEDSYHPGQSVHLDIWTYLPPMETVAQLHRWLHWRLARIEVHECSEWLRDANGKPLFDPHAEAPLVSP